MKNLQELFEHEIKDLYSAEKQLLDVLPSFEEAAGHKKLKKSFAKHHKETEMHFERIQKICQKLEINPGNTNCNAMEGLIKETDGFLTSDVSEEIIDAGLLSCARRIEHYEIAGYKTAYRLAKYLKHKKARKLLKKTLKEEEKADKKLNKLAKKKIYKKALED